MRLCRQTCALADGAGWYQHRHSLHRCRLVIVGKACRPSGRNERPPSKPSGGSRQGTNTPIAAATLRDRVDHQSADQWITSWAPLKLGAVPRDQELCTEAALLRRVRRS